MTTTSTFFSPDTDKVKAAMLKDYEEHLDRVFALARTDISARDLEETFAKGNLEVGRTVLEHAMGMRAQHATEVDLAKRGLLPSQV